MSREIKRPEVKTTWTLPNSEPNSIREFFCSQATEAYLRIYHAEEVTARKWHELISDINFGAELQYISQRAFYCPPYSMPFVRGIDLAGRGWHKDLMNPKSLRLCVEVGSVPRSLELEISTPLCISRNLQKLDIAMSPRVPFPPVALLKQWWRISPKIGVEAMTKFAVLTDTCNQFRLWNIVGGDYDIDSVGVDDDLRLRAIQAMITGTFNDLLADDNILVSVTGTFSHEDNKVLVRILKPQKQ